MLVAIIGSFVIIQEIKNVSNVPVMRQVIALAALLFLDALATKYPFVYAFQLQRFSEVLDQARPFQSCNQHHVHK